MGAMAVLVHLATGERHSLQSEHLIGRGNACHLQLDNQLASSAHAELRWIGTAWELRDLGSRNGTFIDGERLDKGDERVLARGMLLAFGEPEDRWELADDSPPKAHAQNDAGIRREAEAGIIILPDPDNPEKTVFDRHGQWIVESADGTQRPIDDGEIVTTASETWTVHLPVAREHTLGRDEVQPFLRDVTLKFTVSRDQETIEMRVVHPGGAIDMPSRVYMELLLRLAEDRLADQKTSDVASADQGWIFVSVTMSKLGIPDDVGGRNLLSQHIFQARKQLADAGVVDAADIVQRRKTIATDGAHRVSQIRIGARKLEIYWL